MNEQNNDQVATFSKPVLELFLSTLEKEIAKLTQEADKINAEINLRKEALESILALHSSGIGGTEDDEFGAVVKDILTQQPEGLPLRFILKRYVKRTGMNIERGKMFDHLKRRKGIVYEVEGERGAAKWKLIKQDENAHE